MPFFVQGVFETFNNQEPLRTETNPETSESVQQAGKNDLSANFFDFAADERLEDVSVCHENGDDAKRRKIEENVSTTETI